MPIRLPDDFSTAVLDVLKIYSYCHTGLQSVMELKLGASACLEFCKMYQFLQQLPRRVRVMSFFYPYALNWSPLPAKGCKL